MVTVAAGPGLPQGFCTAGTGPSARRRRVGHNDLDEDGEEAVATGRRRAVRQRPQRELPRLLALALATLVAAAAWVLLVLQAISLGRDARNGDGTPAWVLTSAATAGAALCLLLVFALLGRARAAWRGDPVAARRTPGHRRR
jgi:hypothetical protein